MLEGDSASLKTLLELGEIRLRAKQGSLHRPFLLTCDTAGPKRPHELFALIVMRLASVDRHRANLYMSTYMCRCMPSVSLTLNATTLQHRLPFLIASREWHRVQRTAHPHSHTHSSHDYCHRRPMISGIVKSSILLARTIVASAMSGRMMAASYSPQPSS